MTPRTEPAPVVQLSLVERRIRWSALAVMLGLLVEIGSLMWHSPSSFVFFFVVGGLAMATGMLLFLFTIVTAKGEAK